MAHIDRIDEIALRLPEAQRVDVEAWDGHPTFRVNGKSFVFAANDGSSLTVKLPKEEAEAVVATEPGAAPAGYGLGRSGWIQLHLPARVSRAHWDQIEEWIRTSFTLVAPKRLAKQVLEEDGLAGGS
jgi:predicted DNA-binding protein (MmcQ/YjbR family)